MSPTPSQDIATLTIRVSELEKDMQLVQNQLKSYVSQRENELQLREKDLQLKNMQQTLDRIERDQQNNKQEQNDQLKDLNIKVDAQGKKIDGLKGEGFQWITNLIIVIITGIAVTVIGNYIVYLLTRPGG